MTIFRISVTIPKEVFNDAKAVQRIVDAQRRKTGPDIRKMFGNTTEGWKHKPDWSQVQNIGASRIAVRVTPSGNYADQFALVNQGSPPHQIDARGGGILRFRSGYRSATRPRLLRSRAASRYGPMRSAFTVPHPGFDAREFDAEIAEQYLDTFAADMQAAIADK